MSAARAWGLVVSTVAIAAVLSPAVVGGADSFPLSRFPMFSRVRPSPEGTITHALAVTPDGSALPVAPELVANSSSLQALLTLDDAVHRGPVAIAALCQGIAERVASTGGHPDAVLIRIETATYDAVAYFAEGRTDPLSVEHRITCPVAPVRAR